MDVVVFDSLDEVYWFLIDVALRSDNMNIFTFASPQPEEDVKSLYNRFVESNALVYNISTSSGIVANFVYKNVQVSVGNNASEYRLEWWLGEQNE